MTAPDGTKIVHGTAAWFDMVGRVMLDAASHAPLAADRNVCLVERYTDGSALDGGFVQGLRFEIAGGRPSFRYGVRPDERGDITVEVTAAASHTLNTLYGADPRFGAALAELAANGGFKVTGDLALLGGWFDDVHDRIVEATY